MKEEVIAAVELRFKTYSLSGFNLDSNLGFYTIEPEFQTWVRTWVSPEFKARFQPRLQPRLSLGFEPAFKPGFHSQLET